MKKIYDVVFNDDNSSFNKGFKQTYKYCYDWIQNNRTSEQNFKDFAGGTVSIVNMKTVTIVYMATIDYIKS